MISEVEYRKPYRADGSVGWKIKRRESGVYIIRKEALIVYIGMSQSCLYKACYRHFQSWTDYRQKRVVYTDRERYEVAMILTSPDTAPELEKKLILEIRPQDNTKYLEEYYGEQTDTRDNSAEADSDCPF